MKKQITQIGILAISFLACVMATLQTQSRFSFAFSQDNVTWRHYNKKAPTQSERGIREYWANCGGDYHQFEAPSSGTIIDMGSNYDTSEFTYDDDRWLTYCDEHGHSFGSYDVCNTCGEIEGELIYPKLIEGSSQITNMDPAKGFNSVYRITNINNGNQIGVDTDISDYQYIYFALMETTSPDLYVYGGDNRYALINQSTWYYFLLVRDKSTNKLGLYIRNSLNDSWTSKYLDPSDEETNTLSRLRFYNWNSYTNFTIYCSEVYAVEIEEDPCEHVYDEHDICTICLKHKSSAKAYNYTVSGSTKVSFTKPTGFNSVYSVTGKSNGACGVDLDISNYNYLYFALYAENSYVRTFSGGDDGDGSHRIVWSGRWWYLLVEKINGVWNGFIKESSTETWYTRTVDNNTATNFSQLLLLYNWSGLESVTIYNTEIYCDVETPAPVEKAETLNIGVWNGSYHFSNTSSIDDLVSAGMKTVIGVNPIWVSNWNNILNYAATKGVKFIVDPRGWDSQNGRYADWDGTCPSYANHEAVLGFIMYDEPSTLQFDQLAQLKAQFDAVMPAGKLFFVNLLSSAVGMTSLYGSESAQSKYSYYEANYAEAYSSKVSPELFSYDSYPFFTNGQTRKSYFCSLDIWSNLSRSLNIPTWFTFLSASHNSGDGAGYTYVLPTKLQLTWQMSVAISFGMTNLMHYIYATDASDYSCMANIDGSKNAQFDVVSEANSNMHAIDDDLANYGWEGAVTYHNNNKVNLLFKDLQHTLSNSQVGIKSISATSDLLIGSYIDENDNRAYMVTNSGISTDYSYTWDKKYKDYNANVAYTNNANSVSLTVNSDITGAYVIQNGVKTFVSASNNTIALNLEAYGSAFVVLTKQ